MIFLADFSPIRPEPGLILWSTIIFLIFWFIVAKFAFKPIAKALKAREKGIQDALDQAKIAEQKMQQLNEENEKLLKEARVERGKILADAKSMHDKIVADAKDAAKVEANKIVAKAKQEIENEKDAAFADLKNKVGEMALTIAEQILEKNLSSDNSQIEYANDLAKKMNLN